MRNSLFIVYLFTLFIVLVACNPNETTKEVWEDNSPTFTHEYGEMFGKEGSIGIIGPKTVTENGQKWMWHFWGNEDISYKKWEVKAYKQGGDEIDPIIFKDEQLTPRGDEVNGHARSSVLFTSSGLWKLKVYIDGEFFDEIIVDIIQE